MHRNFYNIEIPYKNGLLLYNILNQAFVYLDSDHKKFYLNSDLWQKDPEKLEEFMKLGFILDDDVDEKAIILRNFNFHRWNSDKLHVTVVPTSNCNFRCPYCFVDFNNPKSLSEKHIPLIVDFILEKINKLNVSFLELNFFGGEPLLRMDLILKLCERIRESLPEDIEWASSMFTNGYLLTKDIIELLQKKCMFKWVQITIDGPPDVHNRLRPLKNGKGTFERIFNNLNEIAIIPSLNINLRVNISEENINTIDELLTILQPLLKSHKNIGLNFSPVFNTSSNEAARLMEDWEKFSNYYVNNILPSLIKSKIPYEYFPKPVIVPCTAITPYAYVVDADLSIKKCFEVIGERGEKVGNLMDKKPYLTKQETKWENFELLSEECRNCRYLPICNGGCPWAKMKTGRNICTWLKYGFKEFLKKLHRLKYEGNV